MEIASEVSSHNVDYLNSEDSDFMPISYRRPSKACHHNRVDVMPKKHDQDSPHNKLYKSKTVKHNTCVNETPKKPSVSAVLGKRQRLGAADKDLPQRKHNTSKTKSFVGPRKKASVSRGTHSVFKHDDNKAKKLADSRINGDERCFEVKPTAPKRVDITRNTFRDSIAKAQVKRSNAREKRQQDRQTLKQGDDIQRERKAFRLSLEMLEATVDVEDHLKVLRQLQQLGCGGSFLRAQIRLLQESHTREICYYERSYKTEPERDQEMEVDETDRIFRLHFPLKSYQETESQIPETKRLSHRTKGCDETLKNSFEDTKERRQSHHQEPEGKNLRCGLVHKQEEKEAKVLDGSENVPSSSCAVNIPKNGSKKSQSNHQNLKEKEKEGIQTVALVEELDNLLESWAHELQKENGDVRALTRLDGLSVKKRFKDNVSTRLNDEGPLKIRIKVHAPKAKESRPSCQVKTSANNASAWAEVPKNGFKNIVEISEEKLGEKKRKRHHESSEERKKKKRAAKVEAEAMEYENLFKSWDPTPLKKVLDEPEDLGWLFNRPHSQNYKSDAETHKATSLNVGSKSPSIQFPRAQLLPDADVYALPYTSLF